jgi:hypothetical protein
MTEFSITIPDWACWAILAMMGVNAVLKCFFIYLRHQFFNLRRINQPRNGGAA